MTKILTSLYDSITLFVTLIQSIKNYSILTEYTFFLNSGSYLNLVSRREKISESCKNVKIREGVGEVVYPWWIKELNPGIVRCHTTFLFSQKVFLFISFWYVQLNFEVSYWLIIQGSAAACQPPVKPNPNIAISLFKKFRSI